ncbi:MAG: 23S rRNA (uracil(1939)-C(5))-methyltransferase RlmD [Defluviitaleaceae bacterium]|nr:23S rRNA (uracil(1939)-C(5))-methyltransferase RlmD [Defluviitaleaceae bacterium]
MLEKNAIYSVEIGGLTSEGLGVGKHGGIPIFVRGAAPGDTVLAKVVKVRKSHAFGIVHEVTRESAHRVRPPCPLFGKCGGCCLQHINYDAQLSAKAARVSDCLTRLGGFSGITVDETIAAPQPLRYRNKSVFPVRADSRGKAVCGLFAPNSHRLIPVEDCQLSPPGTAGILRAVESFMNTFGIPAYDENTHSGTVRNVLIRTSASSGDVMVVLVVNGGGMAHTEELAQTLGCLPGVRSVCLNFNRERTNVILGANTTVLWGDPYIEEELCGIRFRISAPSFFQVNSAATEILYGKVLEMAAPSAGSYILDAYCGIGTMSLIAARRAASVTGVESLEQAVADARANAQLNGIGNAEFVAGRTEDVLADQLRGRLPNAVILDPPRKGCDGAVLSALRDFQPSRVVYVSCDPATLARDLKELCRDGLYGIRRVIAVDSFPQTAHVESAVLLIKA